MSTCARSLASFSFAAVLAAGSAASAQGERCSRDTLIVDGSPIAATFCVAGTGNPANVTETFARGTASFSRALAINVVGGAAVTRAVDDVPLDRLGSPKRLHLTLAYRSGEATLEHALLLPGAVILK